MALNGNALGREISLSIIKLLMGYFNFYKEIKMSSSLLRTILFQSLESENEFPAWSANV